MGVLVGLFLLLLDSFWIGWLVQFHYAWWSVGAWAITVIFTVFGFMLLCSG